MKLLRTFPKVAFEFGLASWQWLGLREQTPRFATCFGDIFLESLDGWWFLDTVEGTLELRWTSAVTMYAELESPEGRATYLMDDLVRDARSRGIHLGQEDVYTFNPHPALGGELGVNGLGTMRFELALNWVGQMHDQVLHGSGQIMLPPLPDGGRRAQSPVAREPAWSDETFDVPFEQYLATGAVATVAPPRDDGGYPAFQQPAAHDPFRSGQIPHATTGYEAPGHERLDPPEPPQQTEPWSGHDVAAPLWSGQTETAPSWPALHQTAPPSPTGYDAPDDPSHPTAPEPYGTGAADQRPTEPYAPQGPYAPQSWGSSAPSQDDNGQVQHAEAQPARPMWGSPIWGGQAPAVAADSSPPPPRVEDPFTAWDDLWRKQ